MLRKKVYDFKDRILHENLQEISDQCGIVKEITFHVVRHTFATIVTLSNRVPIETVSKMLGHKKIQTTQIYAKVLDSKVSLDMKILERKLQLGTVDKTSEDRTQIVSG